MAPHGLPTVGKRAHSPLVRRLAEEHGIDLSSLQGTGAGGRITKADVLQAAEKRGAGSEVAAAATGGALDPVRRAIAQRMTQSARDIPHAWTMMEVDVSGLVALVKGLKEEFRSREGVKLTYLPVYPSGRGLGPALCSRDQLFLAGRRNRP